jgi:hypothetical protein
MWYIMLYGDSAAWQSRSAIFRHADSIVDSAVDAGALTNKHTTLHGTSSR